MMELYVVQDTARTLIQFKGEKCKIGVKPLLSFSGSQFESPIANQYTLAKSMFVDFFRGGETQTIDVEGLQLLISFFAGEDGPEGQPAQIHMRCWKIVTKRSGQKVPRVEVEEMGPRIDFTVGRIKEADEALRKEAMKVAKGSEVCRTLISFIVRIVANLILTPLQAKPKKNIATDTVGDKIGRIHLGKQDLAELQTRKMKGLKGLKRARDKDTDSGGDDDSISVSGEEGSSDAVFKRPRLAQ